MKVLRPVSRCRRTPETRRVVDAIEAAQVSLCGPEDGPHLVLVLKGADRRGLRRVSQGSCCKERKNIGRFGSWLQIGLGLARVSYLLVVSNLNVTGNEMGG